jgi:hypothetical protein
LKKRHRRVWIGLVLGCLAAVLLLGAGPREAGQGSHAAPPPAGWMLQEETATPLPTPVPEADPPSGWDLWAMGLLVVFGMIGLMVLGVYVAILLANLREKMRR